MAKVICFNCGKEILDEKIPFMPGKVPGAVKTPIIETFSHPKHEEEQERIIGYEWEAKGDFPFQYVHPGNCQ